MGDHFETCILRQVERFCHGPNSVSSIGVSGDVLIDGLDSNFKPSAAVAKHLTKRLLGKHLLTLKHES
jgi:hypothetical protein